MIEILIITAVFPPEPIVSAKLSYDIAYALAKNNAVSVISPRPSRPFGFQFTGEKLHYRFNHIQLDSYFCASSRISGRLRESYSFGKYCYDYIEENQQDIKIIYANTWPLLGQYFVIKAAKFFNIPILIHVQDIYPESLSNKMPALSPLLNFILEPIDKYVLRNSTRIIAISDQMKNHLVRTRKVELGKVTVVQNWQNEEIFIDYKSSNKMNHSKNNLFTFMYLGNIGPVAGIGLLIEAFAEANMHNSRLVIAGAGSMKELYQNKTEERNLNTIEFWSVPEGKVPEIQEQADVMLLPIKKGAAGSSIPSKLPAYMFSKKPVIACVDYNSDTAIAVRDSDCGWVVAPESVDELAKMMMEVIVKTQEELMVYGNNGFNYGIEHFSKQGNLPKLVELIENTAKR